VYIFSINYTFWVLVILVKLPVILSDTLFQTLSFNMEQWSNDIEGWNPQVVKKPVSMPISSCVIPSPGLVTGYSVIVPTVPITHSAIACLLTPEANDWQFPINPDVKQAANSWLQKPENDYFFTTANKLWCHDGRVFECQWWLYEVWCVPSASHVPCVHQGQSKASHGCVFVSLVLHILCIDSDQKYILTNLTKKTNLSYSLHPLQDK